MNGCTSHNQQTFSRDVEGTYKSLNNDIPKDNTATKKPNMIQCLLSKHFFEALYLNLRIRKHWSPRQNKLSYGLSHVPQIIDRFQEQTFLVDY